MADFIGQDAVQDLGAVRVARRSKLGTDAGVGVQAARLQGAGDEGHAGEAVAGGFLGHVPQAVVGGEVAIVRAQALQVFAQQGEVLGLLGRHAQPVAVVVGGQAGEAPDGVEREVDGVELDVGDGVQQRGPAFAAARVAPGHAVGGQQFGAGRAARQEGAGCIRLQAGCGVDEQVARTQGAVQRQRALHLDGRVGQRQRSQGLAAGAGANREVRRGGRRTRGARWAHQAVSVR